MKSISDGRSRAREKRVSVYQFAAGYFVLLIIMLVSVIAPQVLEISWPSIAELLLKSQFLVSLSAPRRSNLSYLKLWNLTINSILVSYYTYSLSLKRIYYSSKKPFGRNPLLFWTNGKAWNHSLYILKSTYFVVWNIYLGQSNYKGYRKR